TNTPPLWHTPLLRVQPPSRTTVWPVPSICRLAAGTSVLPTVVGEPPVQSRLKRIVSNADAAATSPRSEPSPETPVSVQFVTCSVFAPTGVAGRARQPSSKVRQSGTSLPREPIRRVIVISLLLHPSPIVTG